MSIGIDTPKNTPFEKVAATGRCRITVQVSPWQQQVGAAFKARGMVVGANDQFVAAHARALTLMLVTKNTGEKDLICTALVITVQTDQPLWIKRDDFQRLMHLEKYICRDVQHVYLNAHLHDWFGPKGAAGIQSIAFPTVYFKDGEIYFINGRHRTAVLVAPLDRLPMA